MGAGAIKDACERLREAGMPVGREFEGEYRVDWTNALADGLEHPVIHSTFGYACQLVLLDGEGKVERVVAAHDVGRAVNPLLCEGQVEGSVHMGLGYALTEDFPADQDGRPLNRTLSSLGIIRPKDMPPVRTILVECAQPRAPYGIKGVGEIGLVPTAPAVASALPAPDGPGRTRLPMRPKKGLQRKLEPQPG
jgi:aldehyde oxidoreductase